MHDAAVTRIRMAGVFTEWVRRYTDDPEGFAEDWGDPEDYGYGAADYFIALAFEMDEKGLLPVP